jgi:outer membrane protein OmpA-like peptidoglycan-associated protein
MRILITGLIVFVTWSFFSMWLYVDILKPLTKTPPVVQQLSEKQIREADSLKQFYASMPKDLMIYYEFDKSKFIPDPQIDISITEFKDWLAKYPEYKLHVIGHADFIGTAEYNLKLGSERAIIIQKYLEEKGIGPDKIVTTSRGEEQPVADLYTSAGRAKNRRTEITIKK